MNDDDYPAKSRVPDMIVWAMVGGAVLLAATVLLAPLIGISALVWRNPTPGGVLFWFVDIAFIALVLRGFRR